MLGVLGGGQLGRMFTIAAHQMGYQVTVLDPDLTALQDGSLINTSVRVIRISWRFNKCVNNVQR